MLRVRSLGTVPYHEAYALQHALATEAADDYLLVLQHPHTYTLGKHADERHVLVDPALVGAVLERTDRGGDVTYHGPGQLVAYPVVTVPDDPAAGPAHVHRLEQVVIETLADLGLTGATSEDEYPGVWLDADGPRCPQDRGHRGADPAGRRGTAPHAPRRGPERDHRPRHVRPHRAVRHRRPRGDLAGGRRDRRRDGHGGRRVRGACRRRVRRGQRGAPGRGAGPRRRGRPGRGGGAPTASPAAPGRRGARGGPRHRTAKAALGAGARAHRQGVPPPRAAPSTISGSSPSAKRRAARTSTSAGPMGRRPS